MNKQQKPYLTNQEKHLMYLKKEKNLNPVIASLRIILIYMIIGFLWIFLSDELLIITVEDPILFQRLQLYKGWFYVGASAAIFYLIIFNQMKKYVEKIDGLDLAYIELEKAHQELLSFERQLHQTAYFDDLTQLPNKAHIMKHIKKMVKKHAQDGQKFAVVYFDVDDFRHINEMYGYQAGDQVLIDLSRVLKRLIKEPNLLSRFGEDHFVAVLECEDDESTSIEEVKLLIGELNKSYQIGDEDYEVTMSAGVAFYPKDGKAFSDLMRSVDTALTHAKSLSRDRVVAFQKDMSEARTERIELIQNLHQAIKNKDFILYFQPIYDLKTQKVSNVEALIRWPHVSKGFIPPLDFIPVAEMTGLIHKINDWVFENAFKKYQSWKAHDLGAIKISINLSAKSLINPVFIESLRTMCDAFEIDCHLITLEITETAMIEDLSHTETVLKDLSKMGFEVALDDFGTGYSSLTYLKNLSIHTIKIDRQFISNCIETHNDKETLKYIIDLAHHLNMKVVAEGIENEHQLNLLKSLDCDYAQGYYLGRPMPADDLIKHIQKGR